MTTGLDTAQPAWFFDFVSPFSYLLLEQHDKWPDVPFEPVAVSLPDLQRHWGQRSSADVPAKRVFTYRHALFRAEQLGIRFKMPPAHPFDSDKVLRLAIALRADIATVREMFRFIWRDGNDPSTPDVEARTTAGTEEPRRGTLVDTIVDAFRVDDLPEEMRERLLMQGFVRIDSEGIFAADCYVLPDQIAGVADDELMLNVDKSELTRRH